MAISLGLVPDQVVDIRVSRPGTAKLRVGSGYLISQTLALTARHVVEDAHSADVVFTIRDPARPLAVPADVAWTGAGRACDIALLRLHWADGGPPWPVIRAALGDVSSSSLALPFEALGFPLLQTRELPDDRELRDNDDVRGVILGQRSLRSGLLDLQLATRPAGNATLWTGVSGAAVFARGYLVGVIVAAKRDPAKRARAELTAHRIAVPAGAFRSLSPSYAEPEDNIARFRELLTTDGHDLRVTPARRRPGYAATIDEMVEKIDRRGGLRGREPELAELRAFASPGQYGTGRPYAEWVAPAWSGKTALAAQFAADPPPGVDVVAFFVSQSAGSAGRQQAPEFWDAAYHQLAALVDDDEPAPLTPNRTHFVRLWAAAGKLAERSGRTLVLLIDGLDEDDELPLIANAIPGDGDRAKRVIVFRRDEPELRLAPEHPLTDPRRHVRKALVRTDYVGDLEEEAHTTLRKFFTDRQPEAVRVSDVLGVIAAAGPIGARDIAAVLCAEDPSLPDRRVLSSRQVSPALRRAEDARLLVPLASDPDTFTFHHTTLRAITRGYLAADEAIKLHEDTIKRLAAQYAGDGWPDTTPSYLLMPSGYPAFLEETDDTDRLAALTTRERITRLRARTGDDAAAVGELTKALQKLTETKPGDIPATGRLALRREQLVQALARYPVPLIEAHAALGHWERAEQLAGYQAQPADRVAGLTGMGGTAARSGQSQRADLLFARALRVLPEITDQTQLAAQRQSLARMAAGSERLVAPESVAKVFPGRQENATALFDFASAYASAGLIDYAEQFMAEVTGPEGAVARAAAQADAAVAAAGEPRDHRASYGQPDDSAFLDVARRQAAIQQHLNIGQMLASTAQLVVAAAARRRRLDTVIRIVAAPSGGLPLYLIADACRTAEISGGPQGMAEALAVAYEAARELADPVARAVSLGIIAACARSGAAGEAACEQVAGDAAARARQALAGVPSDQRAEVDNLIATASAGLSIDPLIDWIRDAATRSGDPAVLAASLTVIVQAAATVGLPTADLVVDARDAASKIPDPARKAVALATLAQATAVAAQYAAVHEVAADLIDAAHFARDGRLTAAAHLAAGWGILSDHPIASRADVQASGAQGFAAGQLTAIRSIVASLTDPAGRARASDALVQAAAAEPAFGLAAEARRAAAGIDDPQRQASIRAMIAQGVATAGQLGAALFVMRDMPHPDQQVWAMGMIAQAAVAAGLTADDPITAARDIAADVDDPGRRQAAFAALVPAAAATGQLAVAEFAAAQLTEPGQRAWALGIVVQAAAAAGQPTGDLIAASDRAVRAIRHPAQRTWAMALLARDAAVINQSEVAEGLVSDAEKAALADDPVLRAGVLAAMSRSADLLATGSGQGGQSALFFDQACQAADVPDLALRARALAEISRYGPGQDGWPARLAAEASQVVGAADPATCSEALAALVIAAKRSDADDLALSIAQGIPDPGLQLAAVATLARSAAVKEDYARAEALCGQAEAAATGNPHAPAWAGQAISSARAFCASLRAIREAPGGGLGSLQALLGNEPAGVLIVDGSEERAISRAVHRIGDSGLVGPLSYQVGDSSRRAYLLAEVAERQLAAGDFAGARTTLAAAPPTGTLADRGANGRVLAMTVAALAVQDEAAARARLTSGLADFFSAELVAAMGALAPQALAALASELADAQP